MALPARGILARSVGTLSVLRLRSAALAIDSPQQSQEGPRAPFAPKPILSYLITLGLVIIAASCADNANEGASSYTRSALGSEDDGDDGSDCNVVGVERSDYLIDFQSNLPSPNNKGLASLDIHHMKHQGPDLELDEVARPPRSHLGQIRRHSEPECDAPWLEPGSGEPGHRADAAPHGACGHQRAAGA